MVSVRPGQDMFSIDDESTIKLKNIHMSYGKGNKTTNILNGINLELRKGSIYGLLGPSGCGKTTLLRCIVGKLKPREGSVTLFGVEPGKSGSSVPGKGVGYMPQEIALYKEFSISDILTYYGSLYGLEKNFMTERIQFLLKFLDLPDETRIIKTLSGGQQRRVSIAVALIHVPPLLILDEPTVGVDPLLRQNIWNYLVTLATIQKMTIIVTTHYIEEARQANVVGLLRKGRLLANSDPESLMKQHNMKTLEDVFLKLCLKDSSSKIEDSEEIDMEMTDLEHNAQRNGDIMQMCNVQNNNKIDSHLVTGISVPSRRMGSPPPVVSPIFSGETTGRQRTMVIAKKNSLRMKRNLGLLLLQILLPSIHSSLFCIVLNRQPFDLKFGIIDFESASGKMGYGGKFIDMLDRKIIKQIIYEDPENAIRDIKKGTLIGAIVVGKGFSDCLMERLQDTIFVDEEILKCSTIEIYMDMAKPAITFTLFKSFLLTLKSFAVNALEEFGLDPAIVEPPLKLTPIYGSLEPNFKQCMLPGVVLGLVFTMSQAMTALSLVSEKKEGLVERDWIAGATEMNIILGLAFVQFFVLIIQIALTHFVQLYLYDIKLEGSYLTLWLLTLLQGTCGMSSGLAISTMVKQENSAIMLVLGSYFTNFFLSGIVWPLESMPYGLRYFSYSTPQTFAMEAIMSIFVKGWNFDNMLILLAFAATYVWTCTYLFWSRIGLRVKQ